MTNRQPGDVETITATKLRRDLGAVLDAVARGLTVHVVRHGRPLCTLTPPAPTGAVQSPTKSEER